jgi:hypothetical protein
VLVASAFGALTPSVGAQTTSIACAGLTPANLVFDCWFEDPALGTQNFTTIGAGMPFGDPSQPWIAGSNGPEIDNNSQNGEFNPNSGFQSSDLNSGSASSVSQGIPTQIGHVYSVSFALAGNTAGDFISCFGSPTDKTLTVSFGSTSMSWDFGWVGSPNRWGRHSRQTVSLRQR